jgi:hypothetical protein
MHGRVTSAPIECQAKGTINPYRALPLAVSSAAIAPPASSFSASRIHFPSYALLSYPIHTEDTYDRRLLYSPVTNLTSDSDVDGNVLLIVDDENENDSVEMPVTKMQTFSAKA